MKTIKPFVVVGLFVFFAMPLFAQRQEISSQDFWSLLFDAEIKARQYDRREIRTRELFGDPNDSRTVWIDEYLLPDRHRRVERSWFKGREFITEKIEIGEVKYCRKDNGKWLVTDCNSSTLGGGRPSITEKASRETKKVGNKKFEYYRYYRTFGSELGLGFSQIEVWVDSLGRITKRLETYGKVNTKRFSEKNLLICVFKPKGLKIEKPIN